MFIRLTVWLQRGEEIAYEFKCRNMHVIENNVIVEVLKDGKPVIKKRAIYMLLL